MQVFEFQEVWLSRDVNILQHGRPHDACCFKNMAKALTITIRSAIDVKRAILRSVSKVLSGTADRVFEKEIKYNNKY